MSDLSAAPGASTARAGWGGDDPSTNDAFPCGAPSSGRRQDFVRLESTLFRELMAEREEILRHKWLESEKAGTDIGFDRALFDWVRHHRAGWRRARDELLRARRAEGTDAPSGNSARFLPQDRQEAAS